jgi:hypothetical protein
LFPVSSEPRYYYVDAQNQASGPIALAGLLALKAAGTVTDATLVVLEGGAEWVAFSTLKTTQPTPAPAAVTPAATSSTPTPQATTGTGALRSLGEGGSSSSSTAEPLWASQLSQKLEKLNGTMERLIVSLERSRPATVSGPVPATAALHAEKISLNPTPKPGIASIGTTPAPTPAGIPAAAPRPTSATTLSPLAVPANAQKSALPLPSLGKVPGPAPVGAPKPGAFPKPAGVMPSPTAAPAKGNIFSKFLKK